MSSDVWARRKKMREYRLQVEAIDAQLKQITIQLQERPEDQQEMLLQKSKLLESKEIYQALWDSLRAEESTTYEKAVMKGNLGDMGAGDSIFGTYDWRDVTDMAKNDVGPKP